jgi:8-oxo-dGTP pyrophosphatase MutT (NUDIX family)
VPETGISFDAAAGRIRADLVSRTPQRIAVEGFSPAAVLVPILQRSHRATLLFTRRHEDLPEHSGQISFPGGRLGPGETAVHCALREAQEEIELPPSRVEIVGTLDDQASVTSYVVTPVVGLIEEPPTAFSRQESEVLELFEVPLSVLLDPARSHWEWWGAERMPPEVAREELFALGHRFAGCDSATRRFRVYFFDVRPIFGRPIWGLTARILEQFLHQVFGLVVSEK